MAGVFRGFRTRADLGLQAPRSVSRNISPGGPTGGVTVHYGGPLVGITAATAHEACERRWRGWQAYHMGGNGWADIAYSLGFCQHGFVFAGRGAGVRTAGQGSNDGNARSYAAVFVGGTGDVPTPDALAAMCWCVATLRASKVAPAGPRVWCHFDWYSTECPGGLLTPHVRAVDGRVITAAAAGSVTAPPVVRTGVPALLERDGDLGSATRGALEWYVDRPQDGLWDSLDVRAIQTWLGAERTGALSKADVRRLQDRVGVDPDGVLGLVTVAGLQAWLNRRIGERAARGA